MAGHGGGGRERWLITYADMLTLLLAFFIIMYSISKADAQRFKKFQEGMQQAFHLGVLEGRDAVSVQDTAGGMVGVDSSNQMGPVTLPASVAPLPLPTISEAIAAPSRVAIVGISSQPTPADATPTAEEGAIADSIPAAEVQTAQQIQTELQGIVPTGAQGDVAVELRPEGIVISVSGLLLFDSGDADLQPQARQILDRVAESVRALPYDIRIEGYTDSIQPSGGPYPSNWELSSARALSVTHYLIDHGSIDAKRLSAAAYAEFHPVAPNDTREGRMRNRRIDLVLIPPDSPSSDASPGGTR